MPFTYKVFFGKKGRPEEQVFNGFPKGAVIVGKVFRKVANKVHKRLPCLGIFLAAVGAVNLFYGMAAVLALFIVAKFVVSHILIVRLNLKS